MRARRRRRPRLQRRGGLEAVTSRLASESIHETERLHVCVCVCARALACVRRRAAAVRLAGVVNTTRNGDDRADER